ncbi:MAG TPA: nucleotidyl transferase AbiEii/AbiGii toxin family protein [Chloroflexi bacterium]|nr:nucleotidyl transferase AbiEii/AbiGii toxin family protein [Chloroflexota bacterium]
MRLFEHPEFEQAMLRAAEQFQVSEQFIEKDYYVTEILRIVADRLGDKAMFKGGTSLSKGWGLITRFSEDIDLFVNRHRFDPVPGTNRMNRILTQLTEAVAEHPALTWLVDEGRTIGGHGREDYLSYETKFAALPGIAAVVRLEPGIQSGTFPTENRPITSLVAEYLVEQGRSDMADDLTPFDMTLLHFRRTFVEKMFALHGKVIRLLEEDHPLDRDARHYPDLHVLAGRSEVRDMLASREYEEIRSDYDETSREFFAKIYRPPADLSFADSPALFPEPELRERLAVDYEAQCRLLFSAGAYPSFDEVLERFEEIRKLL